MKINIIVCTDSNNGIGKDNTTPWPRFKEDLKRFRSLTMGYPIIMGRKTHESIGMLLEGRVNIILTVKNNNISTNELEFVGSVDDAIEAAEHQDIFIIGGQSIYEQTIDIADTVYLTKIHKDYKCDRFFHELGNEWGEVEKESFGNGHFDYDFIKLERV